MTSSKPSEKPSEKSPGYRSSLRRYDGVCEKCGGPVADRPAYPFPIVVQVLFALSFIAFLCVIDRVRLNSRVFWAWSVVQIILGFLLVRGRMRAKRRILVCIRCGSALP